MGEIIPTRMEDKTRKAEARINGLGSRSDRWKDEMERRANSCSSSAYLSIER